MFQPRVCGVQSLCPGAYSCGPHRCASDAASAASCARCASKAAACRRACARVSRAAACARAAAAARSSARARACAPPRHSATYAIPWQGLHAEASGASVCATLRHRGRPPRRRHGRVDCRTMRPGRNASRRQAPAGAQACEHNAGAPAPAACQAPCWQPPRAPAAAARRRAPPGSSAAALARRCGPSGPRARRRPRAPRRAPPLAAPRAPGATARFGTALDIAVVATALARHGAATLALDASRQERSGSLICLSGRALLGRGQLRPAPEVARTEARRARSRCLPSTHVWRACLAVPCRSAAHTACHAQSMPCNSDAPAAPWHYGRIRVG